MNIQLLFVLSIEQVIISLMYNPSTSNKLREEHGNAIQNAALTEDCTMCDDKEDIFDSL